MLFWITICGIILFTVVVMALDARESTAGLQNALTVAWGVVLLGGIYLGGIGLLYLLGARG